MKKEYNTKVGAMVMEYVSEKKDGSFDTQEVYDYLVAQGMSTNLTTVYRNLEKLVEKNVIVKFKSPKCTTALYRVVSQTCNCHRHLHMQCRICGKIYHMEGQIMDTIDMYAKNEFNFELDCQNSILTGVCYECSKRQ